MAKEAVVYGLVHAVKMAAQWEEREREELERARLHQIQCDCISCMHILFSTRSGRDLLFSEIVGLLHRSAYCAFTFCIALAY